MGLIYPKSHVEYREIIVIDEHINDKNSKATLGMHLGFECRN